MAARKEKNIEIHFGCLAEDIQTQLRKQGYTFSYDKDEVKWLRKQVHSINILYMGDLLNDEQTHRIRTKLFKQIVRKAKPLKKTTRKKKKDGVENNKK